MSRALVPTLLASALACACGGSGAKDSGDGPSFRSQALQTLTTDGGAYSVGVYTDPQPPSRGVDAIELRFTLIDGGVPDGGVLSVTPWMPAMGHGASVVPNVKSLGGGVYLITDVDFFMPGLWELRSHLAGLPSDDVAPQFQIP